MRLFLNGLVLGIILGVAGYWLYDVNRGSGSEERRRQIESSVARTEGAALQMAREAEQTVKAKLEALDLQAASVSDELTRTGRIIRRKASEIGAGVVDATRDAQSTAIIKAKLGSDPQLSALQISVDTTNGVVTLAGTVSSPELIGRAMLHALQTPGVDRVISTLQPK